MTKKIKEGWMSFQELIGKYEIKGIGEPITNIRIIDEDRGGMIEMIETAGYGYVENWFKESYPIFGYMPPLKIEFYGIYIVSKERSDGDLDVYKNPVVIEGVVETDQSFINRLTYIKTLGA